jgi:hypothetical protein
MSAAAVFAAPPVRPGPADPNDPVAQQRQMEKLVRVGQVLREVLRALQTVKGLPMSRTQEQWLHALYFEPLTNDRPDSPFWLDLPNQFVASETQPSLLAGAGTAFLLLLSDLHDAAFDLFLHKNPNILMEQDNSHYPGWAYGHYGWMWCGNVDRMCQLIISMF